MTELVAWFAPRVTRPSVIADGPQRAPQQSPPAAAPPFRSSPPPIHTTHPKRNLLASASTCGYTSRVRRQFAVPGDRSFRISLVEPLASHQEPWRRKMAAPRHVASTQLPVSPFVESCTRGTTRESLRPPTALQAGRPSPAPASASAFVGFYSGHSPRLQGLNHCADQAQHRKPLRLLKSFLR